MLRTFALVFTPIFLFVNLKTSADFVKNYEELIYPAFRASKPNSDNGYEFEMVDLLGLANPPPRSADSIPTLKSSASQFLLQVYGEISEDDEEAKELQRRHKRELSIPDTNFITNFDREEIQKCNNIITFSSKASQTNLVTISEDDDNDLLISFNMEDVPLDLQLVHAALRLYKDPVLSTTATSQKGTFSISIYRRLPLRKLPEYRIVASLNTTSAYKGWLEFNVTSLLNKWLQRRQPSHILKIELLSSTSTQLHARQVGLATDSTATLALLPFVVGYFNGPELMTKLQRLRSKRDVLQRRQQRRADYYLSQRQAPPPLTNIYRMPKTCERLNFTLDFLDLQMHNWVIAPKKFEAYFCGGECNFPLNTHMNATNHAIVQTLMHLKQPNLPKPCCVPTVLGSISILHYLNEDSVNLSKYPQSVAKECGCH